MPPLRLGTHGALRSVFLQDRLAWGMIGKIASLTGARQVSGANDSLTSIAAIRGIEGVSGSSDKAAGHHGSRAKSLNHSQRTRTFGALHPTFSWKLTQLLLNSLNSMGCLAGGHGL